jgi:hypothetical protein
VTKHVRSPTAQSGSDDEHTVEESGVPTVGVTVAGRYSWKDEILDNFRLAIGLRGIVPYRLRPRNQLQSEGQMLWRLWKSTGSGPYFKLDCPALRAGWYAVAVRIRGFRRTHGTAQMYFDTGDGFSEKRRALIPVRNGNTSMRIVWLPDGARNVRFDPLESAHEFKLRLLMMLRVSEGYAIDRMLRALARHHRSYTGQALVAILASIRAQCQDENETVRLIESRYRQVYEQQNIFAHYDDWILQRERAWLTELAARGSGLAVRPGARAHRPFQLWFWYTKRLSNSFVSVWTLCSRSRMPTGNCA